MSQIFLPLLLLLGAGALPAPAGGGLSIGRCTRPADLEKTKAAGFDYGEMPIREVAALSEADFAALRTKAKAVGLPLPVGNSFLPGDLRLTGPAVDSQRQMDYVRQAFDRLQALGLKIVVFGSGAARNVPAGFPHDRAFAQLVDFGRRVASEAQKRGLTVVVEPLRRQESNIINTAAEGLALVKAVHHPNFALMIDFYHLSQEHEDPAIVLQVAPYLRHVHMANPTGRTYPLRAEEFDYAPFFDHLRAIKYQGRVSVEAETQALAEEGPRAVALLRQLTGPQPPSAR